MTTFSPGSIEATDAAQPSTVTDLAERRLRLVLRANAASSGVAGVVAAVAPAWTADLLGVSSSGWVRVVGIALALFAVDVVLIACGRPALLRRGALLVSVLDAGWVLATVAAIAAGWLNTTGTVLAVMMGIAVADLGALQMWFRRDVHG